MARKKRKFKPATILSGISSVDAKLIREFLNDSGVTRVWLVPSHHSSAAQNYDPVTGNLSRYLTYKIRVKKGKLKLAQLALKRFAILKALEGDLE